MKIWIVKVGEDLPLPGFESRLMRTGLLAEELHSRGHDITWFTSSFRHHNKSFYSEKDERIDIAPNYRIQLMHACRYEKHISLARLWNHRQLGQKLRKFIFQSRFPLPDVIYVAMPILETAKVASEFAVQNKIPYLVDARDLWPDQYLEAFPGVLRPFARVGLEPYFSMARKVFSGADSICGITEEFVKWGLSKTKRKRTKEDRSFPLAYVLKEIDPGSRIEANAFWRSQGVDFEKPIAVFAGTFNRCFDFDPIVTAISQLESHNIQFVLCGEGDNFQAVKDKCKGLKNVFFPGWIDQPKIQVLSEKAEMGLAPYASLPPFLMSVPNKIIEYMGRELFCFSSLEGKSEKLLAETGVGSFYQRKNPKELAIQMRAFLLKSPEERLALRSKAKHLFETEFDGRRVYREFADHLESLSLSRANIVRPQEAENFSAKVIGNKQK